MGYIKHKECYGAAAKSLQSCPTLCEPIDSNPPGSSSLGLSRQEYWSRLPFPSPMHACTLSHFSRVQLWATLWTAAHQAPLSTEFSRQQYWCGLPFPSPERMLYLMLYPVLYVLTSVQFSSVTQSCLTRCDPMNHSTPGLLSITNSRSSLRLTASESVMPSSHLILCRPLLLLPPIPPSISLFQ